MQPNVFHYRSYRSFLKDYYEHKKQSRGAGFSYRAFARLAGFRSPNFLQLVIQGKRNLGARGVEAVLHALRLKGQSADFFRVLVQFEQAQADTQKQRAYEKILRYHQYQKDHPLENEQYEYLAHWYHVAVRELCLRGDFRAEPKWIAKQITPSITPEMAKYSLTLLKRLKLIKKNKAGKYEPVERAISTPQETQNLVVKAFHRQMLAKASEAMDHTPPAHRDISSLTIALSQEKFLEAKRRIQAFRRELNVLFSEEKNPSTVYQFNFQLFNLSKVAWPAEPKTTRPKVKRSKR